MKKTIPFNKNNGQKLNMNINPGAMERHRCLKCGCDVFTQAFILKKCSALQSRNGKPCYVPIPVFFCAACRQVVPPTPAWGNQKAGK